MIILGDAGINFSGFLYDQAKKEYLQSLPITILAVHGNHEMRPASIPDYLQKEWRGGIVYYEEKYPDSFVYKRWGGVSTEWKTCDGNWWCLQCR